MGMNININIHGVKQKDFDKLPLKEETLDNGTKVKEIEVELGEGGYYRITLFRES